MVATNNRNLFRASSTNGARSRNRRSRDTNPIQFSNDAMQGDGNYQAARDFNAAEQKFVASGRVPAAAAAAEPETEAQRQQMFAAEEEGRRRSKGDDEVAAQAESTTPAERRNGANRKRR
jgi:hypothetical protein